MRIRQREKIFHSITLRYYTLELFEYVIRYWLIHFWSDHVDAKSSKFDHDHVVYGVRAFGLTLSIYFLEIGE